MAGKKNLGDVAKATTSKFFSGTPKKSDSEKQVFSFRGDKESVRQWRLYATLVKMQHDPEEKFLVDDIWSAAMNEYIERHPLDDSLKKIFEEKSKTEF